MQSAHPTRCRPWPGRRGQPSRRSLLPRLQAKQGRGKCLQVCRDADSPAHRHRSRAARQAPPAGPGPATFHTASVLHTASRADPAPPAASPPQALTAGRGGHVGRGQRCVGASCGAPSPQGQHAAVQRPRARRRQRQRTTLLLLLGLLLLGLLGLVLGPLLLLLRAWRQRVRREAAVVYCANQLLQEPGGRHQGVDGAGRQHGERGGQRRPSWVHASLARAGQVMQQGWTPGGHAQLSLVDISCMPRSTCHGRPDRPYHHTRLDMKGLWHTQTHSYTQTAHHRQYQPNPEGSHPAHQPTAGCRPRGAGRKCTPLQSRQWALHAPLLYTRLHIRRGKVKAGQVEQKQNRRTAPQLMTEQSDGHANEASQGIKARPARGNPPDGCSCLRCSVMPACATRGAPGTALGCSRAAAFGLYTSRYMGVGPGWGTRLVKLKRAFWGSTTPSSLYVLLCRRQDAKGANRPARCTLWPQLASPARPVHRSWLLQAGGPLGPTRRTQGQLTERAPSSHTRQEGAVLASVLYASRTQWVSWRAGGAAGLG